MTSSCADLSVEFVTTLPGLTALERDYENLIRSTCNTLPFALLDWHLAWLTHYLNLDPRIHDEFCALVLRNQQHTCVAILPFVASVRGIKPFKIVSLDFVGADPSTTETRTPMIMSGYEAQVARAVREKLAQAYDWDWISWRAVTGDFAQALSASENVGLDIEAPGYFLELPSTWQEFQAGLKRNVKESLRHCYNSLKREGLSFSFEVAREPTAVRASLAPFLELHAMRALLTDTVEHFDHFSNSVARAFLYDICERLAKRDAVRIFQLRIGEKIIAARIGFVVNNSLYFYFSGFDPQWRRYSVMTTTVAEALKYAIAQGITSANLSRGTDPSKTRWGPRVLNYMGGLEKRDRFTSRAAYALYQKVQLFRRLRGMRRVWK